MCEASRVEEMAWARVLSQFSIVGIGDGGTRRLADEEENRMK
jgi:hypothetical protein